MEEQVASVFRVLGKWTRWMLVHLEESHGFMITHLLAGNAIRGFCQ